MAENNVQSGSYLLYTQATKKQTIHKPQNQPWHKLTQNKTHTNIRQKIPEELVPLVSPLLKKHTRLGHAGIVDHSVDLFRSVENLLGLEPSSDFKKKY